MRTIFALCSILAFSGCAIIIAPDGNDARFESAWSSNAVKGNGEVTSDKRPVTGLTSLNISGPLQVEVRVGGTASLEIIGDSNLVGLVQAQVTGNSQKIWMDDKFSSTNPIRVVYTVPVLEDVNSNGSGRLMINGLNGGNFNLRNNGSRTVVLEGRVTQLDISSMGSGKINAVNLQSQDTKVRVQGSGSLNLGQVNGNELNVTVHGSGSVNASGNVRNLTAQTHGSGSAELSAVKSLTADLSTYGSGDVSAAVSQNVIAQTTGSGHVTIYGNPAQRNVNGKRVNFIN
ncbi:GIN domain-containing protein [Undibacterium danionis]|uniref:GIN domain-containing protein n=1 Tax=Undibacterium danionis TaxID=1812100 RepID=A0ABV6IFQ1_9BURK